MHDNQKQTHFAYMAGIMDADGCFMITKHKRKTKNRVSKRAHEFPKNKEEWSITYGPCVKIAMIEPEAVDFIMKEMGFGHIYVSGARPSRPNSKDIYQWYLRKKEHLDEFLIGILPYLKVKKNRAEFLLNYCKYRNEFKNPCYKGLTREELEYREQAYLGMRKLNGTKVAATTNPRRSERISDSLNS